MTPPSRDPDEAGWVATLALLAWGAFCIWGVLMTGAQ